MTDLVNKLRQMVANKGSLVVPDLAIIEEAANRIEELERERLSICDVCEALQDSPKSFLIQMTLWSKRIRDNS